MVIGSMSPLEEDGAELQVKIILLGDYSVGKSSLLRVLSRHSEHLAGGQQQYHENSGASNNGVSSASSSPRSSFRSSSSSYSRQRQARKGALVKSSLQPGGCVEVEFTHQDRSILARIADTGGQERYRSMTTSYYRGAHGCLLMFDTTKEESFSNLDTWIENIDSYKTFDDFPCILVGTRCKSPARRIPQERAERYADARGLPYMELDMEHMTDVTRVFESLLDSVTVNLNKRAPIAISIRPQISNKNMMYHKNVACSCS
ncbi:uncharacterized protein LOC143274601 [Babylonia areolata]|uniref:uncharacterized protein LOC143274601 n=1 Tax=Babylonia areolata TaxID=304850 RepID=UPI003FD635ED